MRKKLAIFTAAVGFLTLCNIVLYSRRLRTSEDEGVQAVAGSWRLPASASKNGHEKRTILTDGDDDEWTYNSLSNLSSNNSGGATAAGPAVAALPPPLLVTSKIATSAVELDVNVTGSTSKSISTTTNLRSTTTTTTASSLNTTTSAISNVNMSSGVTSSNVWTSFPFAPQNFAATLANKTYFLNGTRLVVDVPLCFNRTLKVTFNLALLLEAEQGVGGTYGNGVDGGSGLLNTTVESQIDFGANYTGGNSSIDSSDATTVKAIEVTSNTTSTISSNSSGAGGLSLLNEHPFSLMINVEDLCVRNLTLLILVTTAVGHAAHRQAIRETWGGIWKDHPDVRLAFVMGRPQNARQDEPKVIQEALTHADILQEDFLDTYMNLTLKTAMLLKWSQTHCAQAKFVMKTDDDMFINLPNLLKYLRGLRYNRGLLLGRLVRGARPVRTVASKYYVPVAAYKDKVYPDYLSGTGYVMSSDVVVKLYEMSRTTPLFFFEDVFITGICARKARIVRRNHNGFVFYKRPAKGCAFVRAVTGHDNSPNDLRKIWRELQRKNLRC